MGDFFGGSFSDFGWGSSNVFPTSDPGITGGGGSGSGDSGGGAWGFLTNLVDAAGGAYRSTLQADTQQTAIKSGYPIGLGSIFGTTGTTAGGSSIMSLVIVLVVVVLIWKAVSK